MTEQEIVPQTDPLERESTGDAPTEAEVWRDLDDLNLERESSVDARDVAAS